LDLIKSKAKMKLQTATPDPTLLVPLRSEGSGSYTPCSGLTRL